MNQQEQLVAAWYDAQQKLDVAKNVEMSLRMQVVESFFPDGLKEGTNKVKMPENWVLNVSGKLNRKVDEPVFKTMRAELMAAGISVDETVRFKPELSVTAYRTLTEEQQRLFDQVLIITPGTPSVELTLPKRAARS